MSQTPYVNPVKIAQDNLEEATRQLAQATKDLQSGKITQHRFDQLQELKDIATADLGRVLKEN